MSYALACCHSDVYSHWSGPILIYQSTFDWSILCYVILYIILVGKYVHIFPRIFVSIMYYVSYLIINKTVQIDIWVKDQQFYITTKKTRIIWRVYWISKLYGKRAEKRKPKNQGTRGRKKVHSIMTFWKGKAMVTEITPLVGRHCNGGRWLNTKRHKGSFTSKYKWRKDKLNNINIRNLCLSCDTIKRVKVLGGRRYCNSSILQSKCIQDP